MERYPTESYSAVLPQSYPSSDVLILFKWNSQLIQSSNESSVSQLLYYCDRLKFELGYPSYLERFV